MKLVVLEGHDLFHKYTAPRLGNDYVSGRTGLGRCGVPRAADRDLRFLGLAGAVFIVIRIGLGAATLLAVPYDPAPL